MYSENIENQKRNANATYLLLTDVAGRTSMVDLEINSKLFVGSGTNCRLVLAGSGVQPIHCLIWLDEKRDLRVQDWNTNGLTIVNDRPIDEVTLLNSGDELRIGSHHIVPVLSSEIHERVTQHLACIDKTGSPNPTNNERLPHRFFAPAEPLGRFPEADRTNPDPPETAIVATNHAQLDCLEWNSDCDIDLTNEYVDDYEIADQNSFATGSANDELEQLLNEVEQLRYDVADRDSQIRLLTDRESNHAGDDEDDEQTVRLVNRLEELLQELQTTDERARGLEELLKVSDQATRAEQDERRQLESWVTEIEHRITQREAETAAEMQRTLSRLKDADAKSERAVEQFRKLVQAQGKSGLDVSNELLPKLTEQIVELQKRLAAAEAETETLRTQSVNTARSPGAQDELQQMEQKLLQAQVDASREHAELARQRAQLERLKSELQHKLELPSEMGEADVRIRAMRQHLKEIHDQEKAEINERKQRSLGGRISNLLSRVGR